MEYPFILRGKYFKPIVTTSKGIITAECLLCPGPRKTINGSKSATTNFIKHLKRRHPDDHKDCMEKSKVEGKRQKTAIAECSIRPYITIDSNKSLTAKERAYINLVVKGQHPLSMVEQPYFVNFCKFLKPDANVMSQRTLARKMEVMYMEMQTEIITRLATQAYLALTVDTWTCKGMTRSFFGVTVHYITDNLQRKSFAIACRRFSGSHTYRRIGELFEIIFKQYKLDTKKITTVTTDNAANFLKAFREFQSQISDNHMIEAEPEFDFPSIEDVLNFPAETLDEDASNLIVLPPHHPCASHTLNLICSTAICKKESKIHRSSLAQCYGIWNKIGRSTMSHETVVKICECSLTTPVLTRWNSLLNSILSLLKFEDKLDDICDSIAVPKFTNREIRYLKEYVECVEPVAKALDLLQSENHTFYGILMPTLLSLEIKLIKLGNKEFELCKDIVPKLLKGLRTRFEKFLNFEDDMMDAAFASISYPRFKFSWIPEDKHERLQNAFLEKMRTELNYKTDESLQDLLQPLPPAPTIPQNDIDAFCEFKIPGSGSSKKSQKSSCEEEFKEYLECASIDLSMLEKFPRIKRMFLKYNTPLTSSAPVERIFNYSGMILSPNRRNTSHENFEMLLLLKINNFSTNS